MKKLNKKGFTLIELMVVIAILVIIMGIALPNITSSIERSKEKQKDQKMNLLLSEAELYFDRHSSTVDSDRGVYISTLIDVQNIPGITVKDICSDPNEECCIMTNYSGEEKNILYTNNTYYLIDSSFNCQDAE